MADTCKFGHPYKTIKNGARPGKKYCNQCINARRRERRNNPKKRMIEFNGEIKCLTEWARSRGVTATCISDRLKRGWSLEESINGPKEKRPRRRSVPGGGVISLDRRWFIYTLNDPSTGAVRYVGWTTNPAKRLTGHLSYVRNQRDGNLHKANWINKLINSGMRPLMNIIESGYGPGWSECEIKWIQYFRGIRCDLLNITDGGDGPCGILVSPETRLKLSAAMKGRVFTEEWKAKISAAKKGHTSDAIKAAGKRNISMARAALRTMGK